MSAHSSNPQGGFTQPAARGSKVWLWVIAGIVGFFLLIGALMVGVGIYAVGKVKQAGLDPELMESNPALAMTKLLATANPDIEVLKVDEGRGIITVKDKTNGKTFTMNFEDVKQGKMVFQEEGQEAVTVETGAEGETGSVKVRSAEGTVTFGAGSSGTPSWLPVWPGVKVQANMSMKSDKEEAGNFGYEAADTLDNVAKFYENGLRSAGLKVNINRISSDGKESSAIVVAEDEGRKRNAMVTVSAEAGKINVNVTFSSKQ